MTFSTGEKLRIQFRKYLRRGHVKNAEIDPPVPQSVRLTAEPQEAFIVRVDSTNGGHYWFSDRRLVQENEGMARELLRYDAIKAAHWMFSDLTQRLGRTRTHDEASNLKLDHFDRLEIEVPGGKVVLEGLDQAYSPTLKFFWWVVSSARERASNLC